VNFILKNENAIYYESSYSCDNAIFLKMGSEKFFITDSRYTEEAKEKSKFCEVVESDNLIKRAIELISNSKDILEYDPLDWNILEFKELEEQIANLKAHKNLSKNKRIIKTDIEIELISEASKYARSGFNKFKDYINQKGISKKEIELQFKLSNILKNRGKFDLSFDPIVAINENASKPHAKPTNKILMNSDILLVDAGVKFARYCSDRTETFLVQNGNYSNSIMSAKIQKIYDLVKKAHEETIEKVRTGMKASEVDKLARDIISDGGFGDNFLHSTGHGVGLDIHEFPTISKKSDIIIENNMVFTIEPAIYISNFIGIRIEETIVMKNGKAKVL
jgi:Xaa-Pro aminopeptidase